MLSPPPLPGTLPFLRVSNNPIQFLDKKTIFILWSDLREVTKELCPDLHQRVLETKGSPKELVEEATEALEKMLRYINSNNTLKLVFLDKTKCTVHIPGLNNKSQPEVYKWIKDTNQDLTALEDLCFSGILEKFQTTSTMLLSCGTSSSLLGNLGGIGVSRSIPPISQLPGSAAENKRRRAIKSKISFPLLGSDDPIGLEKEVQAHPKKKRRAIDLLRRDEEEEPEVLVDIVFNPQSPEYFDVAYTDSGTIFDPFASSPLVNSPVTSGFEKPGSISSKQRCQVPTSVAEVVAKAKGRTGTQDKFISQVKEVDICFSYLTQDREPPMTKTLAAATLSKEFPNFGNTE
ncbi:hypothetical protein BDR26DRAFT_1006585 [Obelidium mucronatum]|nr:hypothetical protein BDR26DRAFT_1006585 [Obelidium mucronatum]